MKIIEAIQIIRDEFKKICITAILFGVLTAGYSLTISESYKATVVISDSKPTLNLTDLGLGGLIGGASLFSSTSSTHQDMKAIFDGNKVYMDFISENDLLPMIFKDDWDETAGTWKSKPKDNLDGIKAIRDQVEVSYNFDNAKTYLSVIWNDPKIAANWANELAGRANDFITNNELNSINSTLESLTEISSQDLTNIRLNEELNKQLNELAIRTTLKKAESSLGLTIFEYAIAPKKRLWPKRTLMVVLSILVGGFAAATFFIIRRILKETP